MYNNKAMKKKGEKNNLQAKISKNGWKIITI